MAKTAEILEIPAAITDRGQTTVPAAIRKMLALGKRDQVVFRGLADGTVVIAKRQKRADEGDPVIGRFLAFLARDMATEPAQFVPYPNRWCLEGSPSSKASRSISTPRSRKMRREPRCHSNQRLDDLCSSPLPRPA